MRNILNYKVLVLTVGLNVQVLKDVGRILKKLGIFLSGLAIMSFLIGVNVINVSRKRIMLSLYE